MKCLRPIYKYGDKLPCGRCEACLANKTNEYIIRFMATARHMFPYFCTLTYEDRTCPKEGVYKGDVQCWLNILKAYFKKTMPPNFTFKYVLIAEYGGRRCRPHYHVNLFTSHPIELLPTLENTWKFGIVHGRLVTDNALNYIAKYHSTEILSRNIYKFRDYPVFFRVDDENTFDECEKVFYKRFGIKKEEWSNFTTIPCAPPFRMTSKGIGEELFNENSFRQNIESKHYFTINNKDQKCALPRYYVGKLSLRDQIDNLKAKLDYAQTRQSNKIDELAIQLQDYSKALKHYSDEWCKNYEESVLLRKKHNQESID